MLINIFHATTEIVLGGTEIVNLMNKKLCCFHLVISNGMYLCTRSALEIVHDKYLLTSGDVYFVQTKKYA
jgi:hypothetical protein